MWAEDPLRETSLFVGCQDAIAAKWPTHLDKESRPQVGTPVAKIHSRDCQICLAHSENWDQIVYALSEIDL